jgi:hypothetical protein
MRHALSNLLCNLRAAPPSGQEELLSFARAIELSCDRLKAALLARPRYGLIAASTIVGNLRAELVDRAASSEYAREAGPFAWLPTLFELAGQYSDMQPDEWAEAIDDLDYDKESHAVLVEYCLESFDESLEEELENEKVLDAHVACLVQRRLSASLAARS